MQNSRVSPRHRTATENDNANHVRPSDDTSEHIDAIADAFERRVAGVAFFKTLNADNPRTGNTFRQPQSKRPSDTPVEQTSGHRASSAHESEAHSQTRLNRSITPQAQPGDNPLARGLLRNRQQSDHGIFAEDDALTRPPDVTHTSEHGPGFEPDDSANSRMAAYRSESRRERHAGVMRTPDWLMDMQRNLNSRRESNVVSSSEPSINVTIGRVEVRAVHTESETRQVKRDQPVGIMSLEDYLKQRDRRPS